MLTPGQILQGRYRVDASLGAGGMGAVYQAWDTRLKVSVALKEMTPQPGLDARTLRQLRQQFEQEATVLAPLNHPNLVRVTDFFEESGNTYLAMDFVEGEHLTARIERQGALPEKQVLAWAEQLLDALDYCHSQGVIHRDVKPQNIIITPDERAVLVDFGLVKLWDPDDPHTKTAMRGMGTPEYAPPEQYSLQAGHTDPRSDLYGLGASLYHALTGQAPLSATDRMADPERFVTVRDMKPRVSARTESAVTKAMALARSERWQTADEMASALFASKPVPRRPRRRKTPVQQQQPARGRTGTRAMQAAAAAAKAPRTRQWIWLAAVAVVALPALALGVWWVRSGWQAATPEPPAPAATASPVQSVTTPRPTPALHLTDTPRPTAAPRVTDTPGPTDRPSPTATPSPADRARAFAEPIMAAIAGRPPDYADDFGDPNSGWPLIRNQKLEAEYGEGEYAVVVKPFQNFAIGHGILPRYRDVIFQADVRLASEFSGHWGVSWNWEEEGDRTSSFWVPATPTKNEASLVHCDGGNCFAFDTVSRSLFDPMDQVNRVTILLKGPQIAIAVNGDWVHSSSDLDYTGSQTRYFQLQMDSYFSTPVKAYWDNVKMWNITDVPLPTPTPTPSPPPDPAQVPQLRNPSVHSNIPFTPGETSRRYRLFVETQVDDPQGMDDIENVTLTFPDGTVYSLLTEGEPHHPQAVNHISVGLWIGGPLTGEFTLTVTDRAGHSTQETVVVDEWLPLPENVSPQPGAVFRSGEPLGCDFQIPTDPPTRIVQYQASIVVFGHGGEVDHRWSKDISRLPVEYDGPPLPAGEYNWLVSYATRSGNDIHLIVPFTVVE
jgi:predicted Ser/Thr protein kinase